MADTIEMYIDGRWHGAESDERLPIFNPSTGEQCDTIPAGGAADIDRAVAAARRALSGEWAGLKPADRARMLAAAASGIRARSGELSALLVEENGKPAAHAPAEVESAARYTEYYGGLADKISGSALDLGAEVIDFVRREPLGVTAHIIPWNYPLDVFCRSVAPALAAGNSCVVKPSPETARATLAMTRAFEAAGVPAGVLNVVSGDGPTAGAALSAHPDIDAIIFTGSAQTGKAVLRAAAENITPVISLELGSKCPSIVFREPDDLDGPVGEAVGNLLWNCGQSCGQRSRVYVRRDSYDRYVERLAEGAAGIRVGRADDPKTVMGPLASATQYEKVLRMIDGGRKAGARVVAGGGRPAGVPEGGYFVEPTLFSDCRQEMEIVREEVFGPVLAVLPVNDFDEALALANDSPYSLSAAVWTRDLALAHRAIRALDVGHLTINGSDAFGFEVPFGGNRKSGFGREGGPAAVMQYTKEKNVWMRE